MLTLALMVNVRYFSPLPIKSTVGLIFMSHKHEKNKDKNTLFCCTSLTSCVVACQRAASCYETSKLKWWQHRKLSASHAMRAVDGQLCFPCSRAVWRHAGGEWQCYDVIGPTISYCSPVTDNPADLGQRKEGHRSVRVGGLVSSLSSDNLLTHRVRRVKNDLSPSSLYG